MTISSMFLVRSVVIFLPQSFFTEAYCCPGVSVQLPPISVPSKPLWPSSSTPWEKPSIVVYIFSFQEAGDCRLPQGLALLRDLLLWMHCSSHHLYHGHIIAGVHKLFWHINSLVDRQERFLEFDGIKMRNSNTCSCMRWNGILFFVFFLIIYWHLCLDIIVLFRRIV